MSANIEFSLKDGEYLVKLARRTVQYFFETNQVYKVDPSSVPEKLKVKTGVFVTINRYIRKSGDEIEKELRGCIGFPYPIKPLYIGVIEAALEAAFNDPRFPPLKRDELNRVIFEVTILTPPEEIKVTTPLEYLRKIVIGRDGLIIEKGFYRGLLLPQVPVEYGWTVEEYLMHLCMKAGLPPNSWLDKDTKIYRFSGKIFTEVSPNGQIVEETLKHK